MGLLNNVKHIKRYREIAALLFKYGGPGLVKKLGLADYLPETAEDREARAEDLPGELEQLGPTFVKLGQFLSTRRDFIPPAYLKFLAKLQSDVEEFPFDEVRRIVKEEFGREVEELFASFEPKPLAAASIAQVHLARLLETNELVVVKVQRPQIAEQIRDDLEAFQEIADFLEERTDSGERFMLHTTLKEFGKSLNRELDFRKEAAVLEEMNVHLREFQTIVTPSALPALTTEKVLTMQYIAGSKISEISALRRDNVNGNRLADDLFRAYLQQFLLQGVYHADPHPGNVFLTDDNRLALLDFGMVARIPDSMQGDLLRLLLAIGDNNGEDVARFTIKMGARKEDFDQLGFTREVRDLVADYHEQSVDQIESGDLLMQITGVAADHGVRLPNEFVMIAKALLHLDEVARILDPDFNPNAAIRRHAPELMTKLFFQTFSKRKMYGALLEAKEFVDCLPERANDLLETLAANRFRVRADVLNEEYMVSALKEAVNRLTAGLVLSALIVGAAIMLHVDTEFQVFGYPVIAIVCFLLAGLGGLVLIGRMLFRDEAPETVRQHEKKEERRRL